MTTYIGNNGKVKAAANFIAEVTGFTLQIQAATADASALGDVWDVHQIGSKNWSGNITCHWDDTDTNGQETLQAGTSITLGLYAANTTSGSTYFGGTATITQVDMTNTRNATVTRTFQYKGNGALTEAAAP